MRKEFIVERQGRAFCLYAGLLDLAHQHGLKSIHTELVQIPSEANNRVAICSATVVLEVNGLEKHFTGIGDAAPNNVAPAMQTCLLRMAETRAKARALRDAVNIGVAAFEELGEEGAYDGAPERGYEVMSNRNGRPDRAVSPGRQSNNSSGVAHARSQDVPRRMPENSGTAGPASEARHEAKSPFSENATDAQIDAIRSLCRRQALDPEALAKEKCDVESLVSLTHAQAIDLIRELNGKSGARTPAAA